MMRENESYFSVRLDLITMVIRSMHKRKTEKDMYMGLLVYYTSAFLVIQSPSNISNYEDVLLR